MADNTKQHFVPKMLLKRFSWDGINVNMCSIRETFRIKKVPYDPQCQKRYFYGADLHLENSLGDMEALIDRELNKLINGCLVPLMSPSAECLDEDDFRRNILTFIYVQYSRTLKTKKIIDKEVNKKFQLIKDKDRKGIFDVLTKANQYNKWGATEDYINNFIDSLKAETNQPFNDIFNVTLEQYNKNKHLKGVVIFNSSKIPFITGDNPVLHVLTLFPEYVHSFFMPITPAHCLFYYDERYFKVNSIKNVIFTFNPEEVRHLNKMQCENSDINIYLPKLPTCFKMQDLVDENISKIGFWQKINGISLSDKYKKNITIPLDSGHATKIASLNK